MTERRLVIDTDTASDDAVALLLAAVEPGVALEAVTVVAGNVPLDLAVRNALATLDLLGEGSVPVYPGHDAPLEREPVTAQMVHGDSGMGGWSVPEPSREPASEHAVDALVRLARERSGELTLVALGPLTNIAAALRQDPSFAHAFDHVWVMGGAADHVGNVTAVAEYNAWADPEAAAIVFEAGMPLTMVGWDVSRRYSVMRLEDRAQLDMVGTARSTFVGEVMTAALDYTTTVLGYEGYALPDPVTMAAALRPELIREVVEAHVAVETKGRLTRGMTVVDRLGIEGKHPNARVVLEVDEPGFKAMLLEACRRDRARRSDEGGPE